MGCENAREMRMQLTDDELLRNTYFERPTDELALELAKRLENALMEIETLKTERQHEH